MSRELIVLVVGAMAVYALVLGAHALRRRLGLAPFYALLGGLTAVMSWVSDAGVKVEVSGLTFRTGSAVFYTALLLGVFAIYVFDGPRATRGAIATIVAISALTPLLAAGLLFQSHLAGLPPSPFVPLPDLRLNAASVLTSVVDLLFLAVAWELLGDPRRQVRLWLRLLLTLLGVMTLDVILFHTLAFAGRPGYLAQLAGTLVSRGLVALFTFPFLYLYVRDQNRRLGGGFEHRPILAIVGQVAEMRRELDHAQREIERRVLAERQNQDLFDQLQQALTEVKTLRGILPICVHCKKIRDQKGYLRQVETYMSRHPEAEFSHGICPDCARELYPGLKSDEPPEG